MQCRGPKETLVRYNRYVVNGKLFRTVAQDASKRTHNSGVCVPMISVECYTFKPLNLHMLSS
jgi:hypothetical protein